MNFKILSVIAMVTFSLSANAVTEFCPSVEDIKHHHYGHWLPLYVENSEMAMDADVEKFSENVTNFVVARWDRSYLEFAHCFYQGTDSIMDKIVFAHDAAYPAQQPAWSWSNPDRSAECVSRQPLECGYIQ